MRLYKIAFPILGIVIIGAAATFAIQRSLAPPVTSETSSVTQSLPAPTTIRMPFSWDEYFGPAASDPYTGSSVLAARITLMNITYLGIGSTNHSYEYRVYYAIVYLLDRRWVSDSGLVGPTYQLVTAQGNHYDGVHECDYALSQFQPFERKLCYDTFQTKVGEIPTAVNVYEYVNRPPSPGEQQYLAYTWILQTSQYA